jgi:SNF2 family DNA or RNA helicase
LLTPFPYQETAINLGVQRNMLCAYACGLGKTLIAIEIARRLQEQKAHPVLVVCRKSARLQWAYSIADQISNASINVLDARQDYEYAYTGSHDTLDWYIIHHEALRLMKNTELLARTYFGSILVDEAHRFKGRKSQQTKGLKKLTCKRKVALTATEMEKSPADLWSLLNFLYPQRYRGFHGFAAKYVEYEVHPYFHTKKVVGPKNVDKLAKEISPFFIKRTKEEVRPDLPPIVHTRLPIEMDNRSRAGYRQIKTGGDILVEWEDEQLLILNKMSEITKLRRLTSNGLGKYHTAKMEWVKEYIADNPDEAIIVFSAFRDTVIELGRVHDAPVVMGGEDIDLQRLRPDLVFGTIKALGESHDLPWIDTAIFVDCEWSTISMTQASDRIHRINITSGKHAIYLFHPGTVDELVFEALDNKWDNLEVVREYIRRYQT